LRPVRPVQRMRLWLWLLCAGLLVSAWAVAPMHAQGDELPLRMYIPISRKPPAPGCQPIPGVAYAAIPVLPGTGDPVPAEEHPDLNLALRGYRENPTAYRGLVDYGGNFDVYAPQLLALFADQRPPTFSHLYQVYQWDGQWPGEYGVHPITDPDVTLAGLAALPGEIVFLPDRAPDIYQGRWIALVLYATPQRITIKYTRDDNVVWGYTVHIEGLCVEPSLTELYQASVAGGRTHLPGLERGQPIGRAIGDELGVVIRDNGSFMDPRSRKDWWQALAGAGAVPQIDASDSDWFLTRQRHLAQ
jgi:hypothetical protein